MPAEIRKTLPPDRYATSVSPFGVLFLNSASSANASGVPTSALYAPAEAATFRSETATTCVLSGLLTRTVLAALPV